MNAIAADPQSLATLIAPFVDLHALAIVFGGTALAAVLRTPGADLWRGIRAVAVLPRRAFGADPLLDQIAALDRIARRHGVIALDRSVIADADVARAVEAAVDGADQDAITALLSQRIAARAERHDPAAELCAGMAEAAPAMGMVGTLIGLVRMFTAMDDPRAIGAAMAVALLATLYGAMVATLVALPVAARLRRHAQIEARERSRLIAPLAALARIGRANWPREAAA